MKQKLLEATKNILEKNMEITKSPFSDKKIVLIYDDFSELSTLIGESYKQNLEHIENSEVILFQEDSDKKMLQDFLMNLEENSTVILVQSTNFRLDNFRIRLNLKNIGVGCMEHNHLGYMSSDQVENYIDAIEYKTPYYEALSDFMKETIDSSDTLVMRTRDGNELRVEGGFDSVKRNTGDYTDKYRGGTFPVGENFTEAQNFDGVNGSFSIYAYPDMDFQVQFCDPFVVKIEKSMLTCDDPKCPQVFRELLDKIAAGEDGEVMVRELGFGMNTGISKTKRLSDVSAFERVSGFHMSLGKKHQIYRKKLHRKVTQRFHIDVFPDVESITFDKQTVYENGKYNFTQ
ncbi:hypothetical protein LR004_02505 [Candidatus Gracilibacteria bacterium]|nr:hypothetical protein [Candidatus Gracilibacteria bacterium]